MPDTVLSILCVLTRCTLPTNDEEGAIIICNREMGKPTLRDSDLGSLASMFFFFAICHPSVAKQCRDEMATWKSRLCKGQHSIDSSSSLGLNGKFPLSSIRYAEII